jgi:hypothetical protein
MEVDLSARLPNAEALVDSVLSTHPEDTLSDSNTVNLPTDVPIAPALSSLPASVPQQGTPARAGRNRFECEDCHKMFDRPSRSDNCRNLHRGIRPWQCGGRCEDPTWFVTPLFLEYVVSVTHLYVVTQRMLVSTISEDISCPVTSVVPVAPIGELVVEVDDVH